MKAAGLPRQGGFVKASPLWQRAPARDEQGRACIDFMLLIPGLKKQTDAVIEAHMLKIQESLKPFDNSVIYVDLNLRLNLLWISARSIPGISKTITEAIQQAIPEAKVVAADFNPDEPAQAHSRHWLFRLGGRIRRSMRLTRQ
jgi:hypothetical protein